MSIRQVYSYAPGAIPGMQGLGAPVPQTFRYAPGAIPGMQGMGALMVSSGGGPPHEASDTEKLVFGAVVIGVVGLVVWIIVKGTTAAVDTAVQHQQMIDRMAEKDPGRALGFEAGEMGLAILGRAAMRRNGSRRSRRRGRR